MTLIEPSAVAAVMLDEPDGPQFLADIREAPNPVMTIVGKVEAALSVGRATRNYRRSKELVDEFVTALGIDTIGISSDLFHDVLDAYARYGTGHPAGLNFGDCFSYAFAQRADIALIFKGNDFGKTDVRRYAPQSTK